MSWSAQQYVAFEEQRTRPVRDLLAALPAIDARRVVDLGCGPGNSTEVLKARFPGSEVRGIDNSTDMIAAARARMPDARFELADIESWVSRADEPFEVILANAVLQWVPQHDEVLPALAAKLASGGALAAQMPDNLDEPAHVLMREVAAAGPWRDKLAAASAVRTAVPDANWYYDILRSAGCHVDIWRTTYQHLLTGGAADIVEWFKGSGLRPFLAPLDAAERVEFLARYREAVARAHPVLKGGGVLLPFPRLFLVAVR